LYHLDVFTPRVLDVMAVTLRHVAQVTGDERVGSGAAIRVMRALPQGGGTLPVAI
jgi:hypothetical protein